MNVSGLVAREVALVSHVLVSLTINCQVANYFSEGDAKITSSYRRDHRQQHSTPSETSIFHFNFFRQHLSSGLVPFRHGIGVWGCGVWCVVSGVVCGVWCGVRVSGWVWCVGQLHVFNRMGQ